MSQACVTRFAPSPTGELHLGNARTALFNHLLARQSAGRFVLRVEDTDRERSSDAHLQALVTDLEWLGLGWDLGPGRAPEVEWRQSLRGDIYAPLYAQLQAGGLAYPCYCTPLELELARKAQLAAGRPPRYAGTCRGLDAAEQAARAARGLRPTLRFRVQPGQRVEFDDLVHGPHATLSEELGDFVIRRADGGASFLFCNAVDDALMQVSHVLRGEDHLTNTPRQLLVLQALRLPAPRYGHLSLLTGADGAPLSKRHGATSVRELREAGYSPQALLNHLFRLGHSSADHRSLALPELAARLELAHLQRASARHDPEQLRHWQREWAQGLDEPAALAWLGPVLPPELDQAGRIALLRAIRPNVVLTADATDWVQVLCLDPLQFEAEASAALRETGGDFFRAAGSALASGSAAGSAAGTASGAHAGDGADAAGVADARLREAQAQVQAMRAATGKTGAAFFRPLRAALTGRLHGPELAPLLAAMAPGRASARLAAQAGAIHSTADRTGAS